MLKSADILLVATSLYNGWQQRGVCQSRLLCKTEAWQKGMCLPNHIQAGLIRAQYTPWVLCKADKLKVMQPKAAAAPEPVQANSRPSNTYAQRPQQGFAPPPAHQQKLMLCRYYESGKLLCANRSLVQYTKCSPVYRTVHFSSR